MEVMMVHTTTTHTQFVDLDTSPNQDELAAIITLDNNGYIRDCNTAAARLLGNSSTNIARQPISNFVPQFAEMALLKDDMINPKLRYLSRIGCQFDLIGSKGVHISCALYFNEIEDYGQRCLRLIIKPASSQALNLN
jgi:nitrogen-specific signal transduction histidine kinase